MDLETKLKLRELFKKILKDERKSREHMERVAREGGEAHNEMIFSLMANRDNVAEDAH